jgi:hypothetical protein
MRIEPAPLQTDAVQSVQLDRIANGLDEWRNIFRDTRASTHEAVATDLHELVYRGEARQYCAVLDRDVTGELRRVRDDHAVAHVTIVREVDVGHEEGALADRRFERLRRAAVDRRILADARAVADLDPRLLALELEILRVASQHGADANRHVDAEPNVFLEYGPCLQRAAIAECAALADDRVGADRDVVAELRSRRHDRGGMNPGHHACHVTHRSRTMAAISASATSSPSTLATPFIRQIRPRI